jgi:hypothetical protein
METEKLMKGEDSLMLIQRMIMTAKEDIEDKSFYFLLWGWLVFAACIIHFVLMRMNTELAGLGWIILMPAGGIITMIYSSRQKKKQRVQSYINDLMKYVLISFLVSLMIVLFFSSKLGLSTYPMVMLIYGTWLFICGGAIKFKPLVYGGIVNWTIAVVSLFMNFEQQLIFLSIAVLLGYIIPGYLLRKKYKLGN